MRRIAAIMVSLVVLGCGSLKAAEAPAADAQAGREKAMEKVGVMKGRLVAKSQVVDHLLNTQENGINDLYPAVQKLYNQINATIGKQIGEENAKPQEMRNVALVDTLNKKSTKCAEMWTDFNTQWNAYHPKRAVVAGIHSTLYSYVFTPIGKADEFCLSTGVDVELLVPILTAVEKRWDELKAETTALNDNMKKSLATWEAFAKE